MISLTDVSKTYSSGKVANKNINLNIGTNDIIGLVGSNGAGKTTLLRQIVGLIKPTSGSIKYENQIKPGDLIAYFSQKSYMLEALKPYEVIYSTGIYRGLTKKEAIDQTRKLMSFFAFESNNVMSKLSGGQLKIVMLMATFIGKRSILIFDEPTNDLDPINREKFFKLIKEYHRLYRSTIIISSHNLTELETVIDKVIIMKKGEIIRSDSMKKLKQTFNLPYRIEIVGTKSNLGKVSELITMPYSFENDNLVIYTNQNIKKLIDQISGLIEKYDLDVSISKGSLQSLYLSLEKEEME